VLAQALLTTHGEITRGLLESPSPDKTRSLLSRDARMSRWSREVRLQLYLFEITQGLTFTLAADSNSATLSSGGVGLVTLQRPDFDLVDNKLEDAIKDVLKMSALRADRMNEILTQVAAPYSFFAALLNLQPGRHKRTYELMTAALGLSKIAVMQFKHAFGVRRPSDHSPLVQPVLQTPNHGSFPAGHASQCHILADLLGSLVGNKLGADLAAQLPKLADRIGENRVVAGVHYSGDITGGKTLGKALKTYFETKAKIAGSALEWLSQQATAEWP
jgi:hypothetical protein